MNPPNAKEGTHDELCERIDVDIGVGNLNSPCGCYERHLQRALAASEERVAQLEKECDEADDFASRIITLVKSMDVQAEKITKQEGDEDVVIGYKFNTGLWHRILGTIAGRAAVKWLRTPEGQAEVSASAERARATIEELEKARAIDWSKWEAANKNRPFL